MKSRYTSKWKSGPIKVCDVVFSPEERLKIKVAKLQTEVRYLSAWIAREMRTPHVRFTEKQIKDVIQTVKDGVV